MKVKDELKLCKEDPDKVKEKYNFDNNGLFSFYSFLRYKSSMGAVVKCKNGVGAIGFLKTEDGELLVEEQLWKNGELKKRR